MNDRLSWDQYYLNICKAVATNSKCFSRQIGVIIVRDKSIVSTGFNGPPKNVPHCGLDRYEKDLYIRKALDKTLISLERIKTECPRQILGYKSGEGLDLCTAAHAETNAIVNAAKNGISINYCKMYMTCPVPCKECMKLIINAGISEIICTSMTFYDELSEFLLKNSTIEARVFRCL